MQKIEEYSCLHLDYKQEYCIYQYIFLLEEEVPFREERPLFREDSFSFSHGVSLLVRFLLCFSKVIKL